MCVYMSAVVDHLNSATYSVFCAGLNAFALAT